MVSEHDRLRVELGAYLLGSLPAPDRTAVEAHLAACAGCRAELARLAPLPGLLGRITAEDARGPGPRPGPDLLPGALAAVGARRRSERRALARWRLVAAAAVLVAAVAVAAPAVLPRLTGAGTTSLTAAPGVAATGQGALDTKAWGTAVRLDLRHLPQASGYVAFALARDGHGEVAATWGAVPDGHATVVGATAIPRPDLVSVLVRTADGRPVLTLPG